MAAAAGAQPGPEPRRRASYAAGVSLGDGDAALASTAALAFALTRRLGLELELAHARKLDFTIDLCPPPLVCVVGGVRPVTGRTLSLVPHLVVELSPGARRVRLYQQAGAGAGHVRQRYFIIPPSSSDEAGVERTRSKLTAAFSFGGGAAVNLTRRFALGVDVRSLHLRDEEAGVDRFITPAGMLSAVRVAGRASWRF
jgi:hypothetical protein